MNDEVNPALKPSLNENQDVPRDSAERWQQTNSHPSNVMTDVPETGRVLASGFDALTLSLNLTWRDGRFFKLLDRIKTDAIAQDCEMPGVIRPRNGYEPWLFNVLPFGSQGYTWLLRNKEFFLKLTHAMNPKSRPSAMVDIRSETLWRCGPLECVDRIISLLNVVGAIEEPPKVSRVDLCLDILLPETLWTHALLEHAVTKAMYQCAHRTHTRLTGFSIGRGSVAARIYDKAHEIGAKSKKLWMHDIWKLPEVPENARVVRVEFQLRREALTELGIDTVWQLFNHPVNLWSYLVHKWLKFQDDPQKHHTCQHTMPWWKTVQEGFLGVQSCNPLVRAQAVKIDKKRIAQQLMGQLTSLIAIEDDSGDVTPGREINLSEHLPKVEESAELLNLGSKQLGEKVRRKLARYVRRIDKMNAAREERKRLGFPHSSPAI